jgi:hypothetical protein
MMKLAYFLVLMLSLTSSVVNAKYPKTTEQGWVISQNESSCHALTIFEDDTYLSFWVDWRNDRTTAYFTNDKWSSLRKRDGESVRFDFELLGDVEYDKWYSDKAAIVGTEMLSGFTLWWDNKHKLDLLANWAAANSFRAIGDGHNLGQFTLKGSRPAIYERVKCAALGLKNDKSDPFAN